MILSPYNTCISGKLQGQLQQGFQEWHLYSLWVFAISKPSIFNLPLNGLACLEKHLHIQSLSSSHTAKEWSLKFTIPSLFPAYNL